MKEKYQYLSHPVKVIFEHTLSYTGWPNKSGTVDFETLIIAEIPIHWHDHIVNFMQKKMKPGSSILV